MEVYQSKKTAAEMEYALSAIPSIGANNHWFIGDQDTGVSAEGLSPHVGENGNWWVGETDTGIYASGVIVEGAEVGQTIVVKAVDENGKPTEWEPSGKWEEVYSLTLTEEVDSIHIGLPFPLKRAYVVLSGASTTSNTVEAAAKMRAGYNGAACEMNMSIPRVFRKDSTSGFGARFECNGGGVFGFAKASAGTTWGFHSERVKCIEYFRIHGGIFAVGCKVTVYGEREYRT